MDCSRALTSYFVFCQCIEKLGKQFINAEQLNELMRVLDEHLKDHFLRAQQRIEKRKDEDYDEGVEEILEDEVSIFRLRQR